jgi:hypothetical protein
VAEITSLLSEDVGRPEVPLHAKVVKMGTTASFFVSAPRRIETTSARLRRVVTRSTAESYDATVS